MKAIRFLVGMLALTMALPLAAQDAPDEVDSVSLTGTVVNLHSGRIYPNCYLRFVSHGKTVAETTTDSEGSFSIAALPVDTVELHARVKGLLFHQADLVLNENAYLTVSIDTIRLVNLKAVTITAMRHMLGSLLITSTHDRRLWGLNAGYRNGNSSVALPPDAHDNSDAGMDDGMLFPALMPWKVQVAYTTGRFGTTFLTPPIWEVVPDVYHPAPSDTLATSTGSK